MSLNIGQRYEKNAHECPMSILINPYVLLTACFSVMDNWTQKDKNDIFFALFSIFLLYVANYGLFCTRICGL